jgi:hypothetical protein
VRFVFSNATADELRSLGDRLRGTRRAEAAAAHGFAL